MVLELCRMLFFNLSFDIRPNLRVAAGEVWRVLRTLRGLVEMVLM